MSYEEVDTPELRAAFEQALSSAFGAEVRVEHEPSRRWVHVDLSRDGAAAWLLRLTGEHGQRYFDCEGRGVAGLDVPSLVDMVVRCFRNAEKFLPS